MMKKALGRQESNLQLRRTAARTGVAVSPRTRNRNRTYARAPRRASGKKAVRTGNEDAIPDDASNPVAPYCISCGCTETSACLVAFGGSLQGCAWILVDRERGEGLCSACATPEQLVYAVLGRPAGGEGMTVADLAEYSVRSPTRIRTALKLLESRDLVERRGQAWHRAGALAP